jgi:hypothetical protein
MFSPSHEAVHAAELSKPSRPRLLIWCEPDHEARLAKVTRKPAHRVSKRLTTYQYHSVLVPGIQGDREDSLSRGEFPSHDHVMAFNDFQIEKIAARDAVIHTLRKGSGQPLLLLHGYPQTHFIWHKVAEQLTDRYTVVLADLRGYGDSSKPQGGERHENYSFRAMAQDQVDVMRHFGYKEFYVASHDRGARTAHRMCLDHPEVVRKVCFMDIFPTLRMYRDTTKEFATKYMWWFFLIQKPTSTGANDRRRSEVFS